MTTYRLPIEIEHAWANWFLVDFRKESSEKWVEDSTYQTRFNQTKGIKNSPLKSIRTSLIEESIGTE
jgi:hypothetical protein